MATQVKNLRRVAGGYDLRAVKDLRDWIALLKSEGQYREVHAKVDWDVEIGTIARHCMSAPNGPALLFDNIKDHENSFCRNIKSLVNLFSSTISFTMTSIPRGGSIISPPSWSNRELFGLG